ncbi:MAG TPA: putative lipid II flippase FtsW [Patescibacteria group bacterium]|nr:putative lipid II flippase FtsW [Patescibacteria group bacterium]
MRRLKQNKISLKLSHQKADWLLILLVLGLTVFGLIMIANASVVEAYRDFGDKLYYFKLQLQWAGLGLIGFILASFFNYRRLKSLAVPLLIVSLISLGLVLVPGLGTKIMGAQRWLAIGAFRFQPAELAKLAFVFYLAAFMSQKKSPWPFLILLTLLIGLVILEPDLGTAVIIAATGLVVYFASGAPLLWLGLLGILGFLSGLGLIFSSPYRKERVLTFLDPSRDPLGASYHIRQILLALGSGGLFGLGLGQSRQKYEYLPAAATDSIFAIMAEEIGFIGALVIIFVFLLLIWRGFKIAKEAPDKFGTLLATGIISWIGFQTLINLSAIVALVPLTGVPLPFISYGGSSLILIMTASGILVNISKQKVVEK